MSIESICQPDIHATRIVLDLRAQELLHFGKRYNLIEFPLDPSPGNTHIISRQSLAVG